MPESRNQLFVKQRSNTLALARRIAEHLAVKLAWKHPRLYLKLMIKLVLNNSKYFKLVQQSRIQNQKPETIVLQPALAAVGPQKRILYAIHWYELSGAELFALHYMKNAKQLGHACFCISTVPSNNPEKAVFENYCQEALAWSDQIASRDFSGFVADYIQKHQIDTIHIHHSALMYAALPELRSRFSNLRVIDTTHIVEYLSGGFPQLSAIYSPHIDIHNVASKGLWQAQRQMFKREYGQEIDDQKFALTYTSSLTDAVLDESWNEEPALKVITFYGRLALQKQPFIFLETVELLMQRNQNLSIEAHIYGDGELRENLVSRIAKSQFKDRIIYKGRCDNKQKVFKDTSILFLSSLNEGLSFTSFEALVHNRLVISSDVGDQSELLSDECLIPLTQQFIEQAADRLTYFLTNRQAYLRALSKCHDRLKIIRRNEISSEVIDRLYS